MRLIYLLLFLVCQDCFSQNPFITSIYTADPSAHVWKDGRLYVYPSHDIDPAKGCDLMDRYHVFSTADMVNWRDEGEILNAGQVSWGRKEGGFMWAPDCAYKDGTYYYLFPSPKHQLTGIRHGKSVLLPAKNRQSILSQWDILKASVEKQ
jgi:beta-xylosidase